MNGRIATARTVRLLHAAILTGLVAIGLALAVIVLVLRGPLLPQAPNLALVMAGAGAAMLAGALALLRPRVPARPAEQSPEAYWEDAGNRRAAVLLWAVVEGGGIVAATGYLLTGALGPAVIGVFAIAALLSLRPARLQE